MREQIRELRSSFRKAIEAVSCIEDLEQVEWLYLRKKGLLQQLLSGLGDLSPIQRPAIGQELNALKQELRGALRASLKRFEEQAARDRFDQESCDITLPARRRSMGRAHPIRQTLTRLRAILQEMGFVIHDFPEIESEYYNYEGLNYPPDHPARDMQDTFYLSQDTLLRSHTTTLQQRLLEKGEFPLRAATLGKCYRNETITARSHLFFHQFDLIYVDKKVTFADLLATTRLLYHKIFQQPVEMRIRPSYFPFVEPGVEVDVACSCCMGKGCGLCKQSGYLELCGAGMVHPHLFEQSGVCPDTFSGFALGGGVDRIFMLLHGVSDIRLLFDNHLGFLTQFP